MRSFFMLAFLSAAFLGLSARAEEKRKLTKEQQEIWDKALKILAKPDKIVLYSLSPELEIGPSFEKPRPEKEKEAELFRGWKVLGKTEIKNGEERKKIVSVSESAKPGSGARCFEPRHAIAVTAGGKSVDFVICFECGWVYVFLDKEILHLIPGGEHQTILDKLLQDAKVPLALPAKK